MRVFIVIVSAIFVLSIVFFSLLNIPEESSHVPGVFFASLFLFGFGILLIKFAEKILKRMYSWGKPFSIYIQKSLGYKSSEIKTEPSQSKGRIDKIIIIVFGIILVVVSVLGLWGVLVNVVSIVSR